MILSLRVWRLALKEGAHTKDAGLRKNVLPVRASWLGHGPAWLSGNMQTFRGSVSESQELRDEGSLSGPLQLKGAHPERTEGPGTVDACPESQRPLPYRGLCSNQGLLATHTSWTGSSSGLQRRGIFFAGFWVPVTGQRAAPTGCSRAGPSC